MAHFTQALKKTYSCFVDTYLLFNGASKSIYMFFQSGLTYFDDPTSPTDQIDFKPTAESHYMVYGILIVGTPFT